MTERLEVKRCRSCGEPVWWLRNDSTGRKAPIEVGVPEDDRGNVVVDLEAGTYRVLTHGITSGTPDVHINHFARCQASQWHRAPA